MKYQARILVVDDDRTFCESTANVLEREGYAVDRVYSGDDALTIENKNKYAIIIADLMMPGMSGLELLKALKGRKSDAAVIMITGYPSIKSAVQSIKDGAFDYIPKPFTPDELRTLVFRALERRYIYEEMAVKAGVEEKKLVEIVIPKGIYYIPEHAWVKPGEDHQVFIGAHHIFLKTIKEIAAIEFPNENEMRYQGEVCVKISDSHHKVHRLWMPVTGRVIARNNRLQEDFSRLIKDPYQEGWLLMVSPMHLEEELKNLTLSE